MSGAHKRHRDESTSPDRPVRNHPSQSPDSDQSINQLIDQHTNQSYLDHVPSDVFTYLCSYLELRIKFQTLPVLSHSIKSLFNITTCCATNDWVINYRSPNPVLTDEQRKAAIDKIERKLVAGSYVRHVLIDLSRWHWIDPAGTLTHNAIFYQLLRRNLQSLNVKEAVMDRTFPRVTQSHFVNMFNMLSSLTQPIKLRRLSIHLERPTLTYRYPLVPWQGFRNCPELTHFHFQDSTGVSDSSVLTGLLDHIPDSLMELIILSPVCMQQDWRDALSRSDVLPNLRVFSPGGSAPQAFGKELTVIIPETRRARPFEALEIEIDWSVDLGLLSNLKTLQLTMDDGAFDRLVALPDSTVPHLQSCWLIISADDPGHDGQPDRPRIDLSALFIFLSKRPLTEIMFQAKHCLCLPWSDEAVVAMSCMFRLTSLLITLNGQSSFVSEDIRHLLQPGCWSLLTRFEMDSFLCSIEQMEAFISAMPAVVEFQWYDSMLESTFVMSKLVECCPAVERIICCSNIPPTHLHEVEATLNHISFANTLIKSVFIDELDDAALHFVLAKLGHAPYLTEFKLVPKLHGSAFRSCCYRALPHLEFYTVDDENIFDDDREACSAQGICPDNLVSFYMKTANDRLVFNTTLDAQGRDGRQALFAAIYDTLSPAEQRMLNQFDAGDYSAWDADDEPDDMPNLDDNESDGEDVDNVRFIRSWAAFAARFDGSQSSFPN